MNISVNPPPGAGPAEPDAHSTANLNRSLVSLVSEAGINKGYRSYQNRDPPVFKGEPSNYALWKREWQNSVCVGRDDAWVIRNVYENVEVPDDPDLKANLQCCKTQAQVWKLLDRTFANPTIVCAAVLQKFMQTKVHHLRNHTPESQIVSLNLKVQQLLLNLEAVKRENQFKCNPLVLTYAISLLPREYQTEFSKERQKAERQARDRGEVYGDEDLAKLFTDFLDDYSIQFREFQPQLLKLVLELRPVLLCLKRIHPGPRRS